jgi:ABC-type transport system involved in multi-copper enzyme maturation permease subunit
MAMRWVMLSMLVAVGLLGVADYARRRATFQLLGPVFFFDMVRLSRQARFVILRAGYACLLFFLLFLAYRDWARQFSREPVDWLTSVAAPLDQMPKLASAAFSGFMTAQFIAVFLLTPVYTAGAIAEEKDRGTLELLFACGLTSREIVFGKLFARLAHVMALILAGLPVIVFLPFWGGVDPNLVIAAFVITAVTAMSIGSLGLRLSISAARPLSATLAAYAFAVSYMVVSPCIPGLNAWFRVAGVFGLGEAPQGRELVITVAVYAAVHLVVAAGCIRSSIRNLRSSGMPGVPEKDKVLGFRRPPRDFYHYRPRMPRKPVGLVLWKERWVEEGFVSNPVLIGCGALLFVWVAAPFIIYLISLLLRVGSGADVNGPFRMIILIFAAPTMLLTGLGTAGRISRERERRTLDALLTTALDWHDILMGKALAGMVGIVFLYGALGFVAVLGLLAGGINAATFPLLVVAEVIHAAFAAVLGLYVSARARSTVRAMVVTGLILLGVAIIPLFVEPIELLSPQVVIWELGIGYQFRAEQIPRVLWAFGLTSFLYGGAALILWQRTRAALEG